MDSDLQAVQNPDHSIISTMQRRPPGTWLTYCSKPRPFHCQHHPERPPGPWLTFCSKSRPFYCQHHPEKASWTLTYILFKTQTILSLASSRKASWTPTYRLFKTQTILLSASYNTECNFHLQYVENILTYSWLLSSAPLHCLTITLEYQT